MPFKKPFCFHKTEKGKLEVIPHFQETQKLNLEHGFWYWEIKETKYKTKQQKTLDKNQRKWNNIVNKNRGLQDQSSSTPVVSRVER